MNVNEKILTILSDHPYHYHRIIKRDLPDVHAKVFECKGKTFAEKLYNFIYSPNAVCKTCGSDNVKFKEFTTGYRDYCSRKCTSLSEACKQGQQKFFSDTKRMSVALAKRRATCMEKFSGPSPMSSKDVYLAVTTKRNATLSKKFSNEINGRTFKQYSASVRYHTNKTYKQYKHIIDPDSLRSFDLVLDHIYSVYDGFLNDVPVDVISHWSNLNLISRKENSSKHCKSWKTLEQLYEDYKKAQE